MLEFQKLGKLEFGGIKGKILSQQVCRMNKVFLESCEVFRKRTNQKFIFLRKDFWMLSPDQMAELLRSATCGKAFRWLSPKKFE